MKERIKLSESMTEHQFDTGYWYAMEIKEFATRLGIRKATVLRKDELEKAIKYFLRTGQIEIPTKRRLVNSGIRDIDIGLRLDLPIVNYTSNRETKDFLVREALKIIPDLKRKSGARYRLNRWREEQLTKGVKITYRDLVNQYIKLNQTKGRFAQAPSGRYINFLSDFLSSESNATREQAMKAWRELKTIPIPKNYAAWAKFKRRKK